MLLLVGIFFWIVAAAFTGGKPVAFLIAVMCTVIYSQGKRLKALEKGVVPAIVPHTPIEVTHPRPEVAIPVKDSKIESEWMQPPAPKVPHSAPPQEPESAPRLADQVRTESTISTPRTVSPRAKPAQTTSQFIEATFGPTLAGFILRGNPIARIGVVILFFGVIFLLKFAADEGFFPIEVRLIAAAIGAFVLLGLGWKLREKRGQFAITLQGAGAGVFYITCFIAFRLYQLIPGPLAFVLLVAITLLSAALAVLQNARALAVVAMIGGFLAPALTSEGGGNHILLFSYLALLNLGIFGICWFRSWRELNLTGFFFTFVMATLWGQKYYRPEIFSSSEFFLLFFLALYTAITVLFASRTNKEQPGTVDTLMTFGTPLWAFALQYELVKNIEYGLAWSAAGFGAFYIGVARFVFNHYEKQLRLLVQSYFSIGLCFLSLAVPLAFSGRLTAAIWAVEGVALVWSGIHQKHWLTRIAGQVLILLASAFFLSDVRFSQQDFAFLNPYFEGVVLLTFAGLFAARLLAQAPDDSVTPEERQLAPLFSTIGLIWWIGGGYVELSRHTSRWHNQLSELFPHLVWRWVPWGVAVFSIFATLTVVLFWFLARRYKTQEFRFLRHLLVPLHLFFLVIVCLERSGNYDIYRVHPFMSFGFVSWSFFFFAHYAMLHREERTQAGKLEPILHTLGFITAIIVLTWEGFAQVGRIIPDSSSWALAALQVLPALAVFIVSSWTMAARFWPFTTNGKTYLRGLFYVAAWLFTCSFYLNFAESGAAHPLPYVPFLNPLDIAQVLALLGVIKWWVVSKKIGEDLPISSGNATRILGVWLFVWATTLLLRCIHHYAFVAWDFDALFGSNTVQAALSIFWSGLALALMTTAHFKKLRPLWKAGACLIAVVVLKLFLIDLSSQGTVARIAAFLGVGLLMLCIGYLAPIPPENKPVQNEE